MVKVEIAGQSLYIDGYLQANLDTARAVIRKDWDFVFLVDGNEGCITGDTIIRCNRAYLGRKYTIKSIYNHFHGNPDKLRHFKEWDLTIPTYVRSFNGETIRLHKIKDAKYSGKKEVLLLTLANGAHIKATPHHQILTHNGWKRLHTLTKKDLVMTDTPHAKASHAGQPRYKDFRINQLKHRPNITSLAIHQAIYEAHLNRISLKEYIRILTSSPLAANSLEYINFATNHVHHIDGDHYNNAIDNLELINNIEHLKHHGSDYSHFHQGIPAFQKIKSITKAGYEDTYDIICEEPHHNFAANDIIVHNSGKSVLTQQLALYCDESFNIDDIVFTPDAFQKRIMESEPYTAIIYDEAYAGLSSRASMSLINRTLITMLTEIRARNLFVFVVLPTFFDLDRYVALWRSRALIHVYTAKSFQRGYFAFYNTDKKKGLYIFGKKFYSYSRPKPNFIGRFANNYTVNEDEYKEKKFEETTRRNMEQDKPRDDAEIKDALFARLMTVNHLLTKPLSQTEMGLLIGCTRQTIYNRTKKWKEDQSNTDTDDIRFM